VLLSLSTACLYHFPLRYTLRVVAETGFDGIELVMGPEVWLRGVRYVAALAREYSLRIYSVHQTLLRRSPHGDGPRRMADGVEAALALDCPCVVIHGPGGLRWADPAAQAWLRAVEDCQERLAGTSSRLAVENPGVYSPIDAHNLLAPLPLFTSVARRYGLAVTYDTCHAGTAGLDLTATYAALHEHTVNIHLSDLKTAPPPADYHLFYTLFVHHQIPGDGTLPLAALRSTLAANGFAGPLTMEISVVALQAWSPGRLRAHLRRAVAFGRGVSP